MTMRHVLSLIAIGFLTALAACVQQSGQSGAVLPTTPQTRFSYTTLAEVSHADTPGALAAANKTFIPRSVIDSSGANVRDARSTVTFQYYFVHASQAAKPKRTSMSGSGETLGDALLGHDVEERLELQVAMDDLLARYPDCHDVSGVLWRGGDPKGSRYVVQVTFRASGATRTLYYDMTSWADYTQERG
jgi:hypothetical protein